MIRPSIDNATSSQIAPHVSLQPPATQPSALPSRHTWLDFFDKGLLSVGAIALVLALVFFVAYNWMYMGKMGKFALVESALAVCVLGYALLVFWQKFILAQKLLLMMASIATGSLLALVGQVYQTGADTWQLFFSWSLLIIPFVMIARLPALWLLWLGLINISIVFFLDTARFWPTFYTYILELGLIILGVLSFVALYVWLTFAERQVADNGHKDLNNNSNYAIETYASETNTSETNISDSSNIANHRYHWSTYVVGIACAILVTRLGLHHTSYHADTTLSLIMFGLWALIMMFFYWRFYKIQTDLLMLTCFCVSLITVAMVSSVEYLDIRSEAGYFLILALLLIVMSSVAIHWLLRIHKQQGLLEGDLLISMPQINDSLHASTNTVSLEDDFFKDNQITPNAILNNRVATVVQSAQQAEQPSELNTAQGGFMPIGAIDDSTPWYLQLFLAGSGLLSGILIFGFLMLLFDFDFNDPAASLITGGLLLAVSFVLFRINSRKQQAFLGSFAFSLSLAGQVFIIIPLFSELDSTPLSVSILLLLQLFMTVWVPNFLHRLVSGFIALGCLVWLLSYANAPELAAGLLALSASVFSLQRTEFMSYIRSPSSLSPQDLANSKTSQVFKAMALASILMLLTISVFFIMSEEKHYITGIHHEFFYHYPLAQGLLIAASLYTAFTILRRYGIALPSKTGAMVVGAIVLLGIVSVYVSGLLATSLVIVIGVANQQRTVLALGIVALVGYIFWYYYQLDTSLLVKSASMLAVGLLLLLMRWGLIQQMFKTPQNERHPTGGNV